MQDVHVKEVVDKRNVSAVVVQKVRASHYKIDCKQNPDD